VAQLDEAERIQPASRAEWRAWLAKHHDTAPGVWLVTFTRASGRESLSYEDIIAEALCFGWVDSTVRPVDGERTMMYLTRRRRGSTWARTNKERVERLLAEGLMHPAGIAAVDSAKADGSWTLLDPVEALEVPPDLAAALDSTTGARAGYEAMSVSAKKAVLWSVISAKRAETRARRVAAAVEEAVVEEARTAVREGRSGGGSRV
jgi:uncharacterized protein YdeI (YjbR/CyaY-like superfamily)